MKILIVLAVGCAGPRLAAAEKAVPKGDAFSTALRAEYVDLSRSECAEGDHVDSDRFANRAIAAAEGAPAQPEPVSSRKLDEKEAAALEAACFDYCNAFPAGYPETRSGVECGTAG